MTSEEKQLLKAISDMSWEELDANIDSYLSQDMTDEFKTQAYNLHWKKAFNDEWQKNEIDFEESLMQLNTKYRESLISEDWSELLD